MNTFYIDESGSMTKKNLNYYKNQYFVICIIMPKNKDKLKRVYKRFVSSNLDKLKKMDKDKKMFYENGKFKELKGNCFTSDMKRKFINFFCQNNLFEIYYIISDNKKVKDYFYNNTSRAFNYLIKLSFEHFTNFKYIDKKENYLFIDERNVRTDTKSTLEEYLNTELVTGSHIQDGFYVEYCQSETREIIQIADVFANICFTNLTSDNCFSDEITKMINEKYISNEFFFPLKQVKSMC
ncbi:MAG: DUF3800 domain-containing protein [Ruminococcus sp.]|nr:DUF3800 domain-containing protein [Ruminococcus sp.]